MRRDYLGNCMALILYSQDSDDVERRIEMIESEISDCSRRNGQIANVFVCSSRI
ncbi:MAG TPA: hypothetical protein VGA51_15790 [Casimicrobiaceae bacterium]